MSFFSLEEKSVSDGSASPSELATQLSDQAVSLRQVNTQLNNELHRQAIEIYHNYLNSVDYGSLKVMKIHEEFFNKFKASGYQYGIINEPLDFSDTGLTILSDLVTLYIAIGAPYIILSNTPQLKNITPLLDVPKEVLVATMEQTISRERDPAHRAVLENVLRTYETHPTFINIDEIFPPGCLPWLHILSDLKSMNITGIMLSKSNLLEYLPSLERLTVVGRGFRDASVIKNSPSLKQLTLFRLDDLTTLEGIGTLPSLTDLIIDEVPWLHDLKGVEKLPSLLKISICTTSWVGLFDRKLTSLAGIEDLSGLKEISLRGGYGIELLNDIKTLVIRSNPVVIGYTLSNKVQLGHFVQQMSATTVDMTEPGVRQSTFVIDDAPKVENLLFRPLGSL